MATLREIQPRTNLVPARIPTLGEIGSCGEWSMKTVPPAPAPAPVWPSNPPLLETGSRFLPFPPSMSTWCSARRFPEMAHSLQRLPGLHKIQSGPGPAPSATADVSRYLLESLRVGIFTIVYRVNVKSWSIENFELLSAVRTD